MVLNFNNKGDFFEAANLSIIYMDGLNILAFIRKNLLYEKILLRLEFLFFDSLGRYGKSRTFAETLLMV